MVADLRSQMICPAEKQGRDDSEANLNPKSNPKTVQSTVTVIKMTDDKTHKKYHKYNFMIQFIV